MVPLQVAMKTFTFAPSMPRSALAWCLFAGCFAISAGRFLDQRLDLTPEEAQAHIEANLQKLRTDSDAAVAHQGTLITAIVEKKQVEATAAIEKEIPVAAAADSAELAKDVAKSEKELSEAMAKSTEASTAALADLKEKTAKAVTMSATRSVRDVVKETEVGAEQIVKHSAEMTVEATALATEAKGAAKFSQEAAANSALWVKELPSEDAADAVKMAQKSKAASQLIRHEYEDVKRMAKLTGNLALNTIHIAQMAVAQTEKAKEEATKTMEQAAQNALLLDTIRKQTNEASVMALDTIQKIA